MRFASAIPVALVGLALACAEDEGGNSRPKRLAVLCPPVDNESDVGKLPATCSPGEMTTNVDLLVFEGSAYEFAFAASQDPNHCFGSVLTISSHADKEVDYGDMNSEMLFSAFLDDETRSQLSDYDALAVIPSSALSKNDPSVDDPVFSVDDLYSLAFDGQTDNPDDDFWVKSLSMGEGGGVGGSGFSGDGAAIYNNDDESFVSHVRAADGKRRQQQEELSGEEAVTTMDTFGAALLQTLEDPLCVDCPLKFVTGDLLSYGRGSSNYDFKTEYQNTEGSSNYHFKAGYYYGSSNHDFNVDLHDTGGSDGYDFKDEHQLLEPKWKTAQNWRGDPENGVQPKWQGQETWRGDPENGIEPKWKSNGCFDGCTYTSRDGTKGRVCDLSCKTGEPYGTYGCAAKSRKYGLSCRRCYNDVAKALKKDTPGNRAIMCDTLEPPSTYSARRLEESNSEPSPAAELARLLQKYMRKRDDESRDEVEERRPE
ncbi:unnamed protein product [Ectocarpus sp. 6 AP-2014]